MKRTNIQLLSLATKIARKAGKKLRKKSKNDLLIKYQDKHDIKLFEDEETELFIINYLKKRTQIPVLSEENYRKLDYESGMIWIIDPIDGTVNYSRGFPVASVSIALWENGKPLLGVIYDFFHDILYRGIVGNFAEKNGVRISVSNQQTKQTSILLTGKPVALEINGSIIEKWFNYFNEFHKVRMIGSASISLCFLSDGSVDVYSEENIHIWDVAAGLALVKAAGGYIEYWKVSKNNPYLLNVFASNGNIKSTVRSIIDEIS